MQEFEYAKDIDQKRKQDAYLTYTPESVLRYKVNSLSDIFAEPKLLLDMVKHHANYQVPRLNWLESYYLASNPKIMEGKRRQEENKADHRARHAFAAIISDFLNSYVIGNPVKIEGNFDEKGPGNFKDVLDEFNEANDIDAHNVEIGKDQNNMGRAYELLQRTEQDEDKVYRLDPRTVFMIYDNTVRERVIGACRYYRLNSYASGSAKYNIELYTPTHVHHFHPVNIHTETSIVLDEELDEEHSFHGVPVVEYRSDRFRMSVYERQISLIDLYDSAQSDTANYMSDFNDAILVLEGKIKNADDAEYMKKMKDANILVLVPEEDDLGGAQGALKASYLTKSYDVQGVEAYKTRLKDDIYNLSSIPNLSDEAFSGNQSGEALKYKMFGLQQQRNDKELFLAKGFRVRYKLLENLKKTVKEYSGEGADLTFNFTPNLPKAFLDELKAFRDSGGQISQETMLGLLSFVDDVKQELERIESENKTESRFFDSYGFDEGLDDGDES